MRFSVLRLMLAVVPAAAAFAFLRWQGNEPLPSAILGAVIGGSLAGVVLVATKRDVAIVGRDIGYVLLVITGVLIGLVVSILVLAFFFALFKS